MVLSMRTASGLTRKIEVLALARDDVSGAAGKAEAEAARDVLKDRTNESAATGAEAAPRCRP